MKVMTVTEFRYKGIEISFAPLLLAACYLPCTTINNFKDTSTLHKLGSPGWKMCWCYLVTAHKSKIHQWSLIQSRCLLCRFLPSVPFTVFPETLHFCKYCKKLVTYKRSHSVFLSAFLFLNCQPFERNCELATRWVTLDRILTPPHWIWYHRKLTLLNGPLASQGYLVWPCNLHEEGKVLY